MRSVALILCSLYGWLLLFSQLCLARDSLKSGEKISGNKTSLVSIRRMFEMGFFSPAESSGRTYLGIWYYGVTPRTVVWVANRDSPVVDSTGVFEIGEDGNLEVKDTSGKRYWSSELVGSSSKNTTVRLMDSGNLVLRDEDDGPEIKQWQSFEHPTDTFLAGMRMHKNFSLTSWKASDDPGSGDYTFKLGQTGDDRYVIRRNQTQLYWESGRLDSQAMDPKVVRLLSNISINSSMYRLNHRNFTLEALPVDYRYTRLLMNYTGVIQLLSWDNNTGAWNFQWQEPDGMCTIYNVCGNFRICNTNHTQTCRCLPGFRPKFPENQTSVGKSGGCVRISIPSSREDIEFMNLTMTKVGDPDKTIAAATEKQCIDECLKTLPSCQAYSYNSSTYGDRIPSECLIWTKDLPTLREGRFRDGRNLSIPVNGVDIGSTHPSSEEPSTRKTSSSTNRPLLVLMVTFVSLISLACAIIFALVWRRKIAHKQDRKGVSGIQGSLYGNQRHVKELIGMGVLQEKDKEGIEVPSFNFETILAATDSFSEVNKLGRGGYGPVYKGRLPGGQDIAVKRLSSVSTQGLQEFKNEVVLIAKLQHRNLVRLQGYCIEKDEKILLYEYMPNKSLDSFIFDRSRTVLLHWKLRFDIIVGVARGLLYLHQDSRLRVIHRDLKTSNILLDEDMNPKISDFGLARIFGGKEIEACTERVMGTYGYMAPEYALDGLISIKSDVFSFGVVLLEIISGKKNTGYSQSHGASSLLSYAWRLWTENMLLDLRDPCLRETCNANQFVRCATIGLLCVQDEPSDRPTMSNVANMLESDLSALPIPEKPTFYASRGHTSTTSSSTRPETSLHIESSYCEGR